MCAAPLGVGKFMRGNEIRTLSARSVPPRRVPRISNANLSSCVIAHVCLCWCVFECRAQSIRRKVRFLTAAAVKKRRKKVEISFKRHPSSRLRLCYRISPFLQDSGFFGEGTLFFPRPNVCLCATPINGMINDSLLEERDLPLRTGVEEAAA